MTIIAAKAVSYPDMAKIRRRGPSNLFSYNDIWIISITDVGCPVLFDKETDHILPLSFTDYDPAYDYDGKRQLLLGKNLVLFNGDMAQKVKQFITNAHHNSNKPDLLLVNCMMGIRRSGAVIAYALKTCGLNHNMFTTMNPQINPNLYVLRMLLKNS